jgi:hypothetical protein
MFQGSSPWSQDESQAQTHRRHGGETDVGAQVKEQFTDD